MPMFHPTQIGDNSAVPSAHSVMRRRVAGTLLFLFLAASTRCASRSTLERPIPPRDSPPVTIRVAVGDDRHIQELHLEEYVRGSVPAEMSLAEPNATVASRLAQLQSILARTYALANQGRHSHEGFDLCSTTHCQVYRSQASQPRAVTQVVANAVDRTTGLIITDGQGPIQALFHADCGGQTSSATAIWGGGGSALSLWSNRPAMRDHSTRRLAARCRPRPAPADPQHQPRYTGWAAPRPNSGHPTRQSRPSHRSGIGRRDTEESSRGTAAINHQWTARRPRIPQRTLHR